MSSFIINPEKNFPLSFEGFFFNENEYVTKAPVHDRFTFICLNDNDVVEARFTLFIKDQEGLSPWRAPFGSFEFLENLSENKLHELVKLVNQFALEKKLHTIRITSWPDCYASVQAELLKKVLLRNNFQIAVEDHNYHLYTLAPFESLIHVSEKGKLNKCSNAGFIFSVGQASDAAEIHSMVSKARKLRGHPLSMSLEDYKNMFRDFPDRYILFMLHDGPKLIAACTGVKINSQILYNFLGADDPSYKSYSPTVMLMKGVYEYCQAKNYRIFDLGIGTANGIVNPGLVQFKKYLGGKFSSKLSYFKSY